MRVAALCVAPNSVYHALPDVDAFDASRDARAFAGGCPVVAHPPCRAWSTYCRHQAKPAAGEKELGLWCVDQVREWGGILEHPAHSKLWEAADLPQPGRAQNRDFFTLEVWQAWWGYPMKKATWLLFVGINFDAVHLPFQLHNPGADRRRQQVMSKHQRAATCEPLARWLVDYARTATVRA